MTVVILLATFFSTNSVLAIGDHTPDYTQKVWLTNEKQEVISVSYAKIFEMQKEGWVVPESSKTSLACEFPRRPILLHEGSEITGRPNFSHHTTTNTYVVCDGKKWWQEQGPGQRKVSKHIIITTVLFIVLLLSPLFFFTKNIVPIVFTTATSFFGLFVISAATNYLQIYCLITLLAAGITIVAFIIEKMRIGYWIIWLLLIIQAILILLHGWAWPM